MNRLPHALQDVDVIAKLADLKDQHYRNTLLLSAIVELLVEKNYLTTFELDAKLKDLDRIAMPGNPIKSAKHGADRPTP